MDMSKLTQKSQEALQQAQSEAVRRATPRLTESTCCWHCSTSPTGSCPDCWSRPGADVEGLRAAVDSDLARRPRVSGPGAAPGQVFLTQRLAGLLDIAQREADRLKDSYVSVEHLLRPGRRGLADRGRATPRRVRRHQGVVPERADQDPRQPADHLRHTRGHLRGPGEVRHRPRCRR